MEEITTSVNTESSPEATVNAGSVENATETVSGADSSINSNTETAENTVNQQQQTTDNATADRFDDGEKFAKAFSKRLNKEKEKLSKEYEPFKKVVGLAAKQFGMSEEDYIKSILEDYGDEAETKPTQRDERDILIEELLNEKREKEVAQEWERQAKALQAIDSNVSMDKITDDMLALADEKKIPLEYVYAYSMLTEQREAFEKAIEDKVMAKINKANRTAGSLISGKVDTATPSISSMSSKDFEALKERVKRGEKITL